MSIDLVRAYFAQFGMEGRIIEPPVSTATVELAAEALSVEPARIAKTLSFKAGDGCLLLVTAGDARIDNHKFKASFGMKARMLSPEDAQRLTGHAVGGVCPFALPDGVPVYLDASLKRFYSVFPACGSASSAIELTPEALFRYASARAFVDVCCGWEGAEAVPLTEPPLPCDGLSDGEIRLALERFAPENEQRGYVPAYHFRIERASDGEAAGECDLRIGYRRTLFYGGHIGYGVFPAYRGKHYAERACRLLLPFAAKHGMRELFISCEKDNAASRRTLERLGGEALGVFELPPDTDLYRDGQRFERIFRFEPKYTADS